MENSKIGWTDNTWNIAVGCTKVSEGCKYCYMMRDYTKRKWDVDGNVTRTKPNTFNKPLLWQKKGLMSPDGGILKVFTSSLTDVFHESCDQFRSDMWDIISQCPDLMFQILTKRPERVIESLPPDWGDGWDNVAIGITVENQVRGYERITILNDIPSKYKFISFEPLLEMVDVSFLPYMGFIDWAIIGGESGNDTGKWRYRPCEPFWIRVLIDGLKHTIDIPIFVKQLGTYAGKKFKKSGINIDRNGENLENLPEVFRGLNLREMPEDWQ